ncbi:MAG: hypothetical protein ACE5I7_09740 [Candidatus Binatia bacterium]
MDAFARCFLLVFAELYVGGMLALSVPPFHQIGRGFYKSSAAVFGSIGFLGFAGRVALLFHSPAGPAAALRAQGLELTVWAISLLAAVAYWRSLWGEDFRARARHYAWAWMAGLAALAIGAQAFRLSPFISIETVLYPLSFVVSALLLGSVVTGMLLGHWYLIDRGLPIDPFRRLLRLFAVMLAAQAVLLLLDGTLIELAGAGASAAGLAQLFQNHAPLLAARLLLSPVAAGGLAWMIWKTLQIPHTMAATGLFYIAILSVLVGEFMGRFILFRTSLPL